MVSPSLKFIRTMTKEARERLTELFGLFQDRPRLLILIHPDPDSIASALALRRLVLRRCSRVTIAVDEPVKRLQNRAMVRQLKIRTENLKDLDFSDFDLLALVDGQQDHFPMLADVTVDICIDHHPAAPDFHYRFSDIRPELGACSSILFEYLEAGRIKSAASLATAICYGIKTDTDNFTRKVDKLDALAFSKLFPAADYYLLGHIDQVEIALQQLDLFRIALDRLKVKRSKAVVHLGQVPGGDLLVIIADFLIRVSEIETVMVSGFEPGRLTVVFRNRNPRLDIGRVAKVAFEPPGAAGGHRYAARAEVPLPALPKNIQRWSQDQVAKWIERRSSKTRLKSGHR
jgi:nanoRNase/pAp phosphatase (c-di-AMP/oligoRNAs hydrolase)